MLPLTNSNNKNEMPLEQEAFSVVLFLFVTNDSNIHCR